MPTRNTTSNVPAPSFDSTGGPSPCAFWKVANQYSILFT